VSMNLERLARNQVLFREVNERLRDVLGAASGPTEFVCECSNEHCIETVALELDEYERIRSKANRFVVSAGHEVLQVERVAEERDGFKLVEKTVAEDYVVQTDPRSRAPRPTGV
jgi:hypothetical protein